MSFRELIAHEKMSFRELIRRNKQKQLRLALIVGNKPRHAFVDLHGQTLLMYAIRSKRPECARIVAERFNSNYLNLKERANRGSTALHLAVKNQYYDLVRFLVIKGANPNIYDAESHTPLTLAAGPERRRIRLFLSCVVSGAWKRKKWCPAMHIATPPEFQDETSEFVKVNWKLRLLVKDTLSVVLEKLLELHRREHRGEKSLYFDRGNNRVVIEQCAAITKKGKRCKIKVKPPSLNRCWRHK